MSSLSGDRRARGLIADSHRYRHGVALARVEHDRVIAHVTGLDTQHPRPFVVAKIGERLARATHGFHTTVLPEFVLLTVTRRERDESLMVVSRVAK